MGYEQVKDKANHGLVFKGQAYTYNLRQEIQSENLIFYYDTQLGASYMKTRNLRGVALHFQPISLTLLRRFEVNEATIDLGGAAKFDYNLQFYPDLQLGESYWLTDFMLGLKAQTSLPFKQSKINLKFYNSLLGLVSRNPREHNPYFYDLQFVHIVSDVNQDFRFRSLGSFDNTELELNIEPWMQSKWSFSYYLIYYSYSPTPQYHDLIQYLCIKYQGNK
jgi:hypothetical protein